jgi:hypothetical protein
VEAELQRTDQILADAKSKLTETTNVKAEELVDQGVRIQGLAWEAYAERRLGLAGQLTTRARNLATKAIGLLQRRQEDRSFVDQEIERTQVTCDEAGALLPNVDDGRARLLYDQAVRLQDRSKEMFSERRLKQALNLTLRARAMLHKLVTAHRNQIRQREQAARLLRKAQQLIEENRDHVLTGKRENARKLYERSVELCQLAEQAAAKQYWRQAGNLSLEAVFYLEKAARLAKGQADSNDPKQALERAEHRLARIIEEAEEKGTDSADDLIDEIQEKLAKAREYYQRGEFDHVLVIVRVVIELEQQAARVLGEW